MDLALKLAPFVQKKGLKWLNYKTPLADRNKAERSEVVKEGDLLEIMKSVQELLQLAGYYMASLLIVSLQPKLA